MSDKYQDDNFLEIQVKIHPDVLLSKLSKFLAKTCRVVKNNNKPKHTEPNNNVHFIDFLRDFACKMNENPDKKRFQRDVIKALGRLGFKLSEMMYIRNLQFAV